MRIISIALPTVAAFLLCTGAAHAQQSKPFHIKHWSSGMYIHPEGGTARTDVRAVIHAGKGPHTQFYFKRVEGRWGLIIHKQTGLILVPYGGRVDAGNNTELVFHKERGPGAHFSLDPKKLVVEHRSGRFWHPKGGRSRPTNNTAVVVHDRDNQNTKFLAVNPATDKAMGDLFPKRRLTASKPVGSWTKVCQQFCDVTLKQELKNAKTNATVKSRETTNAVAVALEAGIEFPGGSASTTVTSSQERRVGSSMSTELSKESSVGREVKVALDLQTMAAKNLFAVWQWVASTRLSNGDRIVVKTVEFTCTPDARPPGYLPGSQADIRACR